MANKKELIAQYHAATSALCAASDRSNNKNFSDELSELMETKLSPVDRINGESISGIYSYGSFDPEKHLRSVYRKRSRPQRIWRESTV